MHREPLKKFLKYYKNRYPNEAVVGKFIHFVETFSDCFDRSLLPGHVTGSAWIIDPVHRQTLLVYHKKLNLWLQPGGHCDGDPNVARIAHKELMEETGLRDFEFIHQRIFDLDIHSIPGITGTPEHLHYDARFLVYADKAQPLTLSEESNDLRWFPLEKVREKTLDLSIMRMVDKAMDLSNQ